MIRIKCPMCHLVQPELEVLIGIPLQNCVFCGAIFNKVEQQKSSPQQQQQPHSRKKINSDGASATNNSVTNDLVSQDDVDELVLAFNRSIREASLGNASNSAQNPSQGAAKPILESTSADAILYKVEPRIRILFAFLFFVIEPVIYLVYSFAPESMPFTKFFWVAAFTLMFGTYCGMLAGKNGYSEAFTAGGAGLAAGIFRLMMVILLPGGSVSEHMKISLPIFGIYSIYSLVGGIFAFALKRFFDIKLK